MRGSPPEVPIVVDDETGAWFTGGIPMIYILRHFYVNHHEAFEDAIGREALGEVLFWPGYRSAWQWCARGSVTYELRGFEVFRHYIQRLSLRGWGRFGVDEFGEVRGFGRITLSNSVFVLHKGRKTERSECYPFAGWLVGALEWSAQDVGSNLKVSAKEVVCASMNGCESCVFEIGAQ